MVAEWLDAARYADTNGYQGDPTRTNWPWRDWVIEAMNANMPFDQFITEQLAGDLLPEPHDGVSASPPRSTATTRSTAKAAASRMRPRVENVMDRTETVGTVFLGLTVGCTRCHDHKFDPITQEEYYRLYAFFNNSSETGAFDYVPGTGNVPSRRELRHAGAGRQARRNSAPRQKTPSPSATQPIHKPMPSKRSGKPKS